MSEKNLDVRAAIKAAGLNQWQVADALGIRDYNFSRKLRYELPESEKTRIYNAISTLTTEVS